MRALSARETAPARGVDDTEAVALRVLHDDVVRVSGPAVPLHLAGAEAGEPSDLRRLILRVKVEMDAWREGPPARHHVERHVWTPPIPRMQQGEVIIVRHADHIVQRGRPERFLTLEILDANDD